ncbi:uncharacterized protein [Eurosta solidaginis]|uniref:uncharacterized protein n=1 Tax=Eurosta solidaginis TaxID=178769 RepID=UPI0035316923
MRLDTQINDDPLAMRLKSWNLFDGLYTFLTLKGITIEGLKYVKTRHLDEIFGGEKINEKIILEHKVSCGQNEQGIYNLRSQQEAKACRESIGFQTEGLTSDGSSDEAMNFKKPYSVHSILMTTEQGKGICKLYKDTKMLRRKHERISFTTLLKTL